MFHFVFKIFKYFIKNFPKNYKILKKYCFYILKYF